MRLRALLPLILLMPAAQLRAQRIRLPRIFTRTRTPERPAPLPPQPNFIKRDMYYKSWNLSVESYPVFSYMQASGATVGPSTWATLGEGIRFDYRVKPYLSATFDGTYSLFGAQTQTAEFGTRFRPVRSEYNVHPFLDTRIGYTRSVASYGVSVTDLTVSPFPYTDYGVRFSDGIGAVVGAGMDFPLTAAMALTT